MSTVVLLVALRLALGCHFLYEGVWKITHPAQFAAETEGFLSGSRGPLAWVFYSMVPDIDGRDRLQVALGLNDTADGKSADEGNADKKSPEKGAEKGAAKAESTKPEIRVVKEWDAQRQKFLDFYLPVAKDDAQKLQLTSSVQAIYDRHVKGLNEFVATTGPDIRAHFKSLDRFENRAYGKGIKSDPKTAFQIQRRWDEQQALRREAKEWIADLQSRENAMKMEWAALLREPVKNATDSEAAAKDTKAKDTKADNAATEKGVAEKKGDKKPAFDLSPLAKAKPGDPFAVGWNPLAWKQLEQIAFLMTVALTAIGVCLFLGLFTRPAALGGALFMLFVVMSQPSFPGVVPADPPQLGHALLVNKDFIEMLSLFVIATTAVGHWCGLDYFVYRMFVKPFCSKGAQAKN